MIGDRFYREPDPIGIGSIVIRFSMDGQEIDIGQIVGADESLRARARWIVFANGRTQRWHSATITRKLKDWEEAAFVRGAAAAVMEMVLSAPEPVVQDFQSSARKALEMIGNGRLKP
jgi:hypothetical protein